jgi:CheY-like chemotaxis protein
VLTYSIPSQTDPGSMRLSLPNDAQQKSKDAQDPHRQTIEKRSSVESDIGKAVIPLMLSILVVSEQPYSRIAISHHIKVTLPKNIPSQITCAEKSSECQDLIAGENPVVFTHVVISLPGYKEIITLISHLLKNPIHSQTTVLVLTNPNQRTAILQHATDACNKLATRLQFIYKPIKPSRFGDIFDPTKERDASMDRYRDSAQQVVETQKRVFTRLEHEVGNKGYKVLLVEDNSVNQKVLLRFLDKVGLQVETASDGEECVEKVFSKKPGHYGLILCDLHMPRKDGFQATAEIRRWEDEKGAPRVPIVALSANVMSDVADKCALAGFSRYVTKPVNFGELSMTIKELLPSTGSMSPGSPETGDREIERLKEKDKRDRIEAEERRRREAEAAEEAVKASGGDAEPLPSPLRTWPESQLEQQQDERVPRRRRGRER